MATNLRLRPAAEEALRAHAARTGRSQQEVIREAVDRYLGLTDVDRPQTATDQLLSEGSVLPARSEFRKADRLLPLPAGITTLDLLDRDERL